MKKEVFCCFLAVFLYKVILYLAIGMVRSSVSCTNHNETPKTLSSSDIFSNSDHFSFQHKRVFKTKQNILSVAWKNSEWKEYKRQNQGRHKKGPVGYFRPAYRLWFYTKHSIISGNLTAVLSIRHYGHSV